MALPMIFTLLSTVMFTVQNVSMKEYSAKYPDGTPGSMLLNFAQLLVVCIITALLGGVRAIPLGAFAIAAGFGICLAGTLISISVGYGCGPVGLTALITNASLIIPSVFATIYWHEPLTVWKIAATVLILIMLALTSINGKSEVKPSKKWTFFIAIAFLLNGSISVIQKFYTEYYPLSDFPECTEMAFSFYAAVAAAVCCGIVTLVFRLTGTDLKPWYEKPARFSLFALMFGLGTTGGTVFTMYALTYGMPSTILFPVRQGLLVLIMWLYGIVKYREKLTSKGIITLIIGLAGIILINF